MNKHMKKITAVLSIIISVLVLSCNANGGSKKEGNIKITGTLENVAGKKLILEQFVNNQPETIDTAIVEEDGSFEIALTSNTPDFYRLSLSPQNAAILILSPDEKLSINGNGNDMMSELTVEGSENTTLLWSYYAKSSDFGKQSQALRDQAQSLGKDQAAERQIIIDQFNQLNAEFIDYTKLFIDDNSSSLAVFPALGNLNIDTDIAYFETARDGLKANYSESNYYKTLDQQIEQYQLSKLKEKMFDEGNVVPNITQNDPNGNPLSLYDLRGEVVLIDFWASWCRPCRAENPNVVKLYNKYHKDGFDIFSVSLDKDQAKWVQAIEADGLIWPNHVSDLQYWQSEAAQLYNVKSIPFTVLLDRDGKVIGTKLRGPQLEAKLKEIFGY
jgi:thiol-disulfide isomerase/thioredoxin